MDLELKGKVAIVGGGSKGLGRACAEILAEEGVKVTICSRTRGDLEKVAEDIRSATGSEVLVGLVKKKGRAALRRVAPSTASAGLSR